MKPTDAFSGPMGSEVMVALGLSIIIESGEFFRLRRRMVDPTEG